MRNYLVLLGVLLTLPSSNVFSAQERNIELLASSCAACHGTRGHSAGGFPSLAGMASGHIVEQMTQFVNGQRPSTVMIHHANGYTKEEIKLLAQFFSEQ